MTTKQQPHNAEAERSIIGALVTDGAKINDIIEIVKPSDFYYPANAEIYKAILFVNAENQPIDLATISEKLTNDGNIEKIGGLGYLVDAAQSIATTHAIKAHAHIVADKSKLRNIIATAGVIAQMAYEGEDVSEVLNHANKSLCDIDTQRQSDITTAKEEFTSYMHTLDDRMKNKGKLIGLSTGFTDLDFYTGGFLDGQSIIIAARPAMGKTSLAVNIATCAALFKDEPVLFFSLEMGKSELMSRIVSSVTSIRGECLKLGTISPSEYESINGHAKLLASENLHFVDKEGLTIEDIKAKALSVQSNLNRQGKRLRLIVIDHIGLINGKIANKRELVEHNSMNIKRLAKLISCPIVTLSQLSRAVESRTPPIPQLSDLRESGAIEQDADIVMLLYREEYYKPDTDRKNICDCIIAKQRDGKTGTVNLLWRGELTKFDNLSKRNDLPY